MPLKTHPLSYRSSENPRFGYNSAFKNPPFFGTYVLSPTEREPSPLGGVGGGGGGSYKLELAC